jgi:hypothetical protein
MGGGFVKANPKVSDELFTRSVGEYLDVAAGKRMIVSPEAATSVYPLDKMAAIAKLAGDPSETMKSKIDLMKGIGDIIKDPKTKLPKESREGLQALVETLALSIHDELYPPPPEDPNQPAEIPVPEALERVKKVLSGVGLDDMLSLFDTRLHPMVTGMRKVIRPPETKNKTLGPLSSPEAQGVPAKQALDAKQLVSDYMDAGATPQEAREMEEVLVDSAIFGTPEETKEVFETAREEVEEKRKERQR